MTKQIALTFTVGFLVMNAAAMATSELSYLPSAFFVTTAVLGILLLFRWWLFGEHLPTASEALGLKKTALSSILPGAIVVAALLLMYPVLSLVLRTPVYLTTSWASNLMGVFLTGGIAEEMLFRGSLFGSLRRQMSFRRAVFASMLVFTVSHLLLFTYLDWSVALMSTLLAVSTSIPLAILFEFGKNAIWGPVFVHTTIRTIGMVVATRQDNNSFSLAWILCCIVVPYIVLIFLPDIRKIWKRGPTNPVADLS